jgi:hypothetical protein
VGKSYDALRRKPALWLVAVPWGVADAHEGSIGRWRNARALVGIEEREFMGTLELEALYRLLSLLVVL